MLGAVLPLSMTVQPYVPQRHFAGLHGPLEGPEVSTAVSHASLWDIETYDENACSGVPSLRTYSMDEMLENPDCNYPKTVELKELPIQEQDKESRLALSVRPVNGGREGIELPVDRPGPAGPDSPELPEALFSVPVALIDAILTKVPPVDLPIRHFWGDGFLVREMLIPAGTLIVARRYKVPHVCFCTMGEITVWGDGVDPVLIDPPLTIRSEPGVQRIGYAHADTLWSTILPNPQGLTDPEAVLDACAEVTPLAYPGLTLRELLALVETPVRAMLTAPEETS